MTTDQADPPVEWVSIPEASQRLGISIATVRRRIKQGALAAELEPGLRGPEYRVRLPSLTTVPAREDAQAIIVLSRVVEQQQAELREVRDRLEAAIASSARADLLEAEVERLRAELERARRPWWRFWR